MEIAKTNCVIIHGCPSDIEKAMDPDTRTYDKHWIPWIKQKLTKHGIDVQTPLMPDPWEPDYEKFKQEFEKNKITENSIFIGHSCGGTFLVRWLGESKQPIKKLILVAPWKIPSTAINLENSFYEYPIDETIQSRAGEIIFFTSDNEEEDGKKSLKIFHKALGGTVIELKEHGHYTMSDMGTEEFPELLHVVLK